MSDIIEIHLLATTPQEVIQDLRTLVVVETPTEAETPAGSTLPVGGNVLRTKGVLFSSSGQVGLIPIYLPRAKRLLKSRLMAFLIAADNAYYVSGSADRIARLLKDLLPYIREIKINNSAASFDQVARAIKIERLQPTPTNDPQRDSGDFPMIS
jgi:hypothetical protein